VVEGGEEVHHVAELALHSLDGNVFHQGKAGKGKKKDTARDGPNTQTEGVRALPTAFARGARGARIVEQAGRPGGRQARSRRQPPARAGAGARA